MESVAGTPVPDKPKDIGPTAGPYFAEPIPADWHTDPDSGFRKDSLFMIVDSRSAGEVIAVVEQVAGGFDEAQANARLFASSWSLLDALKGLVEATAAEVNEKGGGGYVLARLTDARAAIAKAEGR